MLHIFFSLLSLEVRASLLKKTGKTMEKTQTLIRYQVPKATKDRIKKLAELWQARPGTVIEMGCTPDITYIFPKNVVA